MEDIGSVVYVLVENWRGPVAPTTVKVAILCLCSFRATILDLFYAGISKTTTSRHIGKKRFAITKLQLEIKHHKYGMLAPLCNWLKG